MTEDGDWESRYYIGETDETFENVESDMDFISFIYSGMWNIGSQTEIDAISVKSKRWGKKHKEKVKEAFEALLLKFILSGDYEGDDGRVDYDEASAKEEVDRLMKTYALISNYFQYKWCEGIWEDYE